MWPIGSQICEKEIKITKIWISWEPQEHFKWSKRHFSWSSKDFQKKEKHGENC